MEGCESSIPAMEEEWSPAAATPPKAPATVPRPAPTCRQQIEIGFVLSFSAAKKASPEGLGVHSEEG